MTALTIQTEEKPDLVADLQSRVEKLRSKAAEPTTDTGQSELEASPAEPTVAPTPAPGPEKRFVSLEDHLPEDFEHGFFKGKPVKEFVHGFKATEAELKKVQEKAARLSDTERQLRAEVAAAREYALQQQRQQQAQPPATARDEDAELQELWFANPAEAARRIREAAIAEARQTVATETQRFRQETAEQGLARQQEESFALAVREARSKLSSLDDQTYELRMGAVLFDVTNPSRPYLAQGGPLNPANLLASYRDLFGEPEGRQAPPPVVAAIAPAANPPGSARPTAPASQPNRGLPTLSEARRDAIANLAAIAKVDPENVIRRSERRGGSRG